jgi:hypothetical protein
MKYDDVPLSRKGQLTQEDIWLIDAAPRLFIACVTMLASFRVGGKLTDPHAKMARIIIEDAVERAKGKRK